MSTIVTDIFNAIKNESQTILGVEYVALRNIFNPELEDNRNSYKAFGVKHGAAQSADGITRVYTLDHKFEVLLVNRAPTRDDDAAIQVVINELYNKADDLLRNFFLKKLGLSAIILIIDQPELSDPEILANDAVLLRVGFNIKYRKPIT